LYSNSSAITLRPAISATTPESSWPTAGMEKAPKAIPNPSAIMVCLVDIEIPLFDSKTFCGQVGDKFRGPDAECRPGVRGGLDLTTLGGLKVEIFRRAAALFPAQQMVIETQVLQQQFFRGAEVRVGKRGFRLGVRCWPEGILVSRALDVSRPTTQTGGRFVGLVRAPGKDRRRNDLDDATCGLNAGQGVGRELVSHGFREQTVCRDIAAAALGQLLAVIKHVD
jgi:hypothetical protein